MKIRINSNLVDLISVDRIDYLLQCCYSYIDKKETKKILSFLNFHKILEPSIEINVSDKTANIILNLVSGDEEKIHGAANFLLACAFIHGDTD